MAIAQSRSRLSFSRQLTVVSTDGREWKLPVYAVLSEFWLRFRRVGDERRSHSYSQLRQDSLSPFNQIEIEQRTAKSWDVDKVRIGNNGKSKVTSSDVT